ncbi:hypothetical protein [Microcoleus sp. T3B2]|uniref:hypothetical protein n=1 Tax=Microcoleus sp. T3B2 TaxID=3055426 RepID=UPI002FD37AF7
MPVPQENLLCVEQASCLLSQKSARCEFNLRCCTIVNKLFRNRQDACSTRKFTLCGTGILPVLENGARCEVNWI